MSMSSLYPQLFPPHLLMEHPSLHHSHSSSASPAQLAPSTTTTTTRPPSEPESESELHDSPTRTATSAFGGQPSSSDSFPCAWKECTRSFADAESLYNHLCNEHIGRKSTNNLCLTCQWKDCGTTCAKRDHITSHLRVHTPLKPHSCEICKKTFKRPQDLKKHEKIHTEEHHAAHKHSKAITVSDPAFAARVRGQDSKHSRSQSAATPIRNASGTGAHPGVLSDYGSSSHLYPSWDDPPRTAGLKRSHDYDPVDDFLGDVKKRRLAPSYTGEMASTLSSLGSLSNLHQALANHMIGNGLASQPLSLAALAALNSRNSTPTLSTSPASSLSPPNIPGLSGSALSQSHTRPSQLGQPFNPTSVSLDIRTPEELQAVNAFLLALGRDITSVPRQPLHESHNHHSHSQSHPAPRVHINDTLSPETWFSSDTFAQFGLSSLPGLAAAHDSQPSYSQSLHGAKHAYSDSSNISSIYRHFDDLTTLGLGSGHERKLAVSSLTPPPASVSPISTSSSIGSSHATGGPASLEAPHHMRSSSSSESHPQYIEHVGGIGHQVKTSFGSQVRRTSLSGGQLSAPSLGVREGAGLLGPQGVKSPLRLQASPRAAAEREMMGRIKEDKEDDDEDIDELADDASIASEGVQEKMVLDVPSRLPTPVPASRTAVTVDTEGSMSASDPELAAHKPGHSLYPLLHIEGDPALKLPALDFKGESKSPALPSIAATVPISSLRSSASTKGSEPPSVSSLYADLSSAANVPPPSSSLNNIQDRALSPSASASASASSASSASSMSPRRPSISSVSSSSPSAMSRNNAVLPSLASVILDTPPRAEDKPLTPASVSVEEISMEERARHATLVRNLIIYVNLTYLKNQEALERAADAKDEINGEGMEIDEDGEVRSTYRAGSVESRTSVRSVSVGA